MSEEYKLNPEQTKAIEHDLGPLMIIAGAGTGKTSVIVERLAWLITKKDLRPEQVLCLTFTDKSANEMVERVDRRLPTGYVDLWVSTFHSFGERVLRENAIDLGLPGDFQILSERQQWLFIRQHLDKFPLDYYQPFGKPTKFLQSLVKHFSRLKDELISPDQYLEYVENKRLDLDKSDFTNKEDSEAAGQDLERLQELAGSYHVYNRLLRERGFLDFGDLIVETLNLFKKRAALLKHYREQFRYVLVDEFQDTNWAQYELVKILAAPNNNLTVVGDDDQSIYKFRGASVANILEFKRDFPNSTDIVLTQNYRSRQSILDAAYSFIQGNNPNRLEAQLKDDQVKLSSISKRLVADQTGDGQIKEIVADTETEEVQAVIEQILELKNNDKELSWSDIAILGRANNHLESFLNAAERSGIPYQYVAARGLYRQAVVIDILAYLRLLDDYHENVAIQRVLTMPIFEFDPADIITLNQHAKKNSSSVYHALQGHALITQLSSKGHQEADKLLSLIHTHTTMALKERLQVSRVVYSFLEESGYLQYLSQDDDAPKQAQLHYLSQFYREVTDFERGNTEPSVKQFVDFMDSSIESGEEGQLSASVDDGPDTIKLMTVHAAKGLEFRYVFVVNLVERRFPSSERSEAITIPDDLVRERLPEGQIHLEEERRLFYVALTRAKQAVWLTRALNYGGKTTKRPSTFLIELGITSKEQVAKEKIKQPSLLNLQSRTKLQSEPEVIIKRIEQERSYNYSALSAYNLCPWKYRYRYVLSVPEPGNKSFSFGQSIHATLYDFFRMVQERSGERQGNLFGIPKKADEHVPVSLDELKQIYERNWLGEWYDNQQQMEQQKKKGWENLKVFYNSHESKFPVPRALEQSFTMNLNDYQLVGKIDRIDPLGDGVEIIDYKTGKAKEKPSKEAKYQLLLYTLAVQDPDLLNLPVKLLSFWYIDENKKISFEPTEKDVEKAKNWALEEIDKVRQGDFTATPSPQICAGCEFKTICPFRAG
ncbi:MAG: UvrD-helicase domain-containing protein [bacterium]